MSTHSTVSTQPNMSVQSAVSNEPVMSVQSTVSTQPIMSTQSMAQIKSNPSSHSQNVEQVLLELVKSLSDQVNLGRLPAPEPAVFTGDPLKYPGWEIDFTTLIEQRKVPPTEHIHYLKKYLGGAAKDAVGNCFLLASDNAYEEAKKLLHKRFGAAYVVGNAFRDKLEKWPKIGNKDANALQRFSDLEENQNSADSRTITTTAYLCIY